MGAGAAGPGGGCEDLEFEFDNWNWNPAGREPKVEEAGRYTAGGTFGNRESGADTDEAAPTSRKP